MTSVWEMRCTQCGQFCDDDSEAPLCERCSERIYGGQTMEPLKADFDSSQHAPFMMPGEVNTPERAALRSVLEGMRTLSQRFLSAQSGAEPLEISEVYDVIREFVPDNPDLSSWRFDDVMDTAKGGMDGDDAKHCNVERLKLGINSGTMWIEIEGGFEDVPDDGQHPVSVFIQTHDLPPVEDEPEDDDPICANCGVYRSEHSGMGCEMFSRTAAYVISGAELDDYFASQDDGWRF
jgi:hypothetical protein